VGTVHSLFIADSVAGNAGSARRHSQGQTELKDSLPPVSGGDEQPAAKNDSSIHFELDIRHFYHRCLYVPSSHLCPLATSHGGNSL
jgi:hypothetical protein